MTTNIVAALNNLNYLTLGQLEWLYRHFNTIAKSAVTSRSSAIAINRRQRVLDHARTRGFCLVPGITGPGFAPISSIIA